MSCKNKPILILGYKGWGNKNDRNVSFIAEPQDLILFVLLPTCLVGNNKKTLVNEVTIEMKGGGAL